MKWLLAITIFLTSIHLPASADENKPGETVVKPLPHVVAKSASAHVRAPGELEPVLAPEEEPPKVKPVTLFGGLQATSPELDKDVDDSGRDLSIEWDDWRNRFSLFVQSGVSSELGFGAINIPTGLRTWYRCHVTDDHHVVDAEITKCSGVLWFDKAVLEAIRKLDGKPYLRYPRGSHRTVVTVEMGIIRENQAVQRRLHFGDVEHQRVPSRPGEQAQDPPKN